jgi:tRNA G18 (ribose-2'-O)-methylase SpoU
MNGVRLAESLKSSGNSLWSLEDIPCSTQLYELESLLEEEKIILIVGNENCGVDPAILKLSDQVISIPMFGNKQSYNVAVAFGMAASFLLYRHNVSHGSLRILPRT